MYYSRTGWLNCATPCSRPTNSRSSQSWRYSRRNCSVQKSGHSATIALGTVCLRIMQVTLAVEDILSRAVARRLIDEYLPTAHIFEEFVTGGSIESRILGLNQRALYIGPVLAIADLDKPRSCPAELVGQFSKGLALAPTMLIRIAVLEIESWILADRAGIAKWLGVASSVVTRDPELLGDPKHSLVQLASRSSKRYLREAIAPRSGLGTSRTGPDYNDTLEGFVSQIWDPETARRNAPSLDRAITRIAELGAP